MINIAVMGYGTVGSGVVEVINTNGARINQRIGDELNIKYVTYFCHLIVHFYDNKYKYNSFILN